MIELIESRQNRYESVRQEFIGAEDYVINTAAEGSDPIRRLMFQDPIRQLMFQDPIRRMRVKEERRGDPMRIRRTERREVMTMELQQARSRRRRKKSAQGCSPRR